MGHRDRADAKVLRSDSEQENPRKMTEADKGQFDEVLRRMVRKNPQKTVEIRAVRPGDGKSHRRKNPYEGLLPDDYKLDGTPLTPEQIADVERQKKILAGYEKRKRKKKET